MDNIKDFVEKAIGATIVEHIYTNDSDVMQDYHHVIDSIIEQDDETYNIVTETGYILNMPDLETIDKILDGTPYIKQNYHGFKQIINIR